MLNDDERVRVGTLYKQVSAFDAKKLGAALVSRNIARHLDTTFAQRPRNWRPLVYCWRGGSRSEALAHVLREVGWRADAARRRLQNYRRAVIDELEVLPQRYRLARDLRIDRLRQEPPPARARAEGAQVLDLEALAAHRGSVLGNLPDAPQPSQKMFESLLWVGIAQVRSGAACVRRGREQKDRPAARAGNADRGHVGKHVREARCGDRARVAMLIDEYRHFVADPGALGVQLDCLRRTTANSNLRLEDARRDGGWDALVRELLEMHYDPAYTRSTLKHYPQLAAGTALTVTANSDASSNGLLRNAWPPSPGNCAPTDPRAIRRAGIGGSALARVRR